MADITSIDQKLLQRFTPCQTLPHTHLNDLLKGSQLLNVERGSILFKATDQPKQTFYLVNGSVDLRDATGKKLSTLTADSGAAHRALNSQYQQPMTAVAAANSTLLVIDKNLLDLVLAWDQAGEYVVADLTASNSDDAENESDWMSSLLQSPLFTQIPAANIQQLLTKFEAITVKAEQLIIKEGEPGDYFYVISKGSADVTRRAGAEIKHLATLTTGSLFGEEALISESPRNASVTMRSDGLLMRLSKADFTALLHKPLLHYIKQEQVTAAQQNPSNKIQLIDVRFPIEFKGGHLEGSINIPLPTLRSKLDSFDTNTTYVVVCDGGRRSEVGAHILSQLGLNAYIFKF